MWAFAILRIMSCWVRYRHDSSTSAHQYLSMTMSPRLSPMDYFAERQIQKQHRVEVRLGMWKFALLACACALSINNPSIRKSDPKFSNRNILTNVLRPAPWPNIITWAIWIMRVRKIRGKGWNVCSTQKCTFHWKMHVSMKNAQNIAKCII